MYNIKESKWRHIINRLNENLPPIFIVLLISIYFSRVSIIRGRVVTMSGQGIIGVRVSVDRTKDSTNYGFTLSRPGGWYVNLFDIII